MIEMVKVLATENATTSPPMIAADVMKHFEEKYNGKAFVSVDRNYMENLVYRLHGFSDCTFSIVPVYYSII